LGHLAMAWRTMSSMMGRIIGAPQRSGCHSARTRKHGEPSSSWLSRTRLSGGHKQKGAAVRRLVKRHLVGCLKLIF
jgi:hypothetical protein